MPRTKNAEPAKKPRKFTVTVQIPDNLKARFEDHRARIKVRANSEVALSLLCEGLEAVEARS